MKISLSWLNDFIDIKEDVNQISETLTGTGLEVEGIETFEEVQGSLEGLVIGEVLSCEKHPDADKLSLTTVDIGEESHSQIVCGAPNVAKGQKVVVATVGAQLYPSEGSPFKIKRTKIRGVESLGMICAEDEIGMGNSHDGILVLDTDLPNGTAAKEYFQPYQDQVFEIGLTPNRADGASHFGTARDLKAAFDRDFRLPNIDKFKVANTNKGVEVEVENLNDCPRYCGLTISDVKVNESPRWLKNKLRSIGLEPINNVVDVTNYVLHALGQPLHAFDLSEIKGNKVIVKNVAEGTNFTTLDGKERKLSSKDLMICNDTEPMCIAGVFGGLNSGLKSSTTDIFLESAYFKAGAVRNTATRHALKTDASFRYERGTDPNMPLFALKWAALLIQEIAGGEVSSEVTDIYPDPIYNFEVEAKYKNIDRLIGQHIPASEIKSILESLSIVIDSEDQDGIKCSVPPFRVDVTREADLVEEILRIYGYNNIALSDNYGADYLSNFAGLDKTKILEKTGQFIAGLGFNEIMSNSLTDPNYIEECQTWSSDKNVEVLNKLSNDLGVLRQTLIFSGLEALKYNINRKQANLKFFEFGSVYTKESDGKYTETEKLALFITGNKSDDSWQTEKNKSTFHDLSSVVYKILNKFNVANLSSKPSSSDHFDYGLDIALENGSNLVSLGKLSKGINRKVELNQEVFYAEFEWKTLLSEYDKKITFRPVSKYPEVKRDLSLVIDKSVKFDDILSIAKTEGNKLVKDINVFSIYEGDNIGEDKKSYALSFILQDEQKTLKDKIIDKTMNHLIQSFESKLNAIIRK